MQPAPKSIFGTFLSTPKISLVLLLFYAFSVNECFFTFIDIFGGAARHLGSQFPDQVSNLRPVHRKHGVLTTGPPGTSQ